MGINGILGAIIFLADIFAIYKIANSRESIGIKIIWILIVFILPLLGLIAWFIAGPGDKSLKL